MLLVSLQATTGQDIAAAQPNQHSCAEQNILAGSSTGKHDHSPGQRARAGCCQPCFDFLFNRLPHTAFLVTSDSLVALTVLHQMALLLLSGFESIRDNTTTPLQNNLLFEGKTQTVCWTSQAVITGDSSRKHCCVTRTSPAGSFLH